MTSPDTVKDTCPHHEQCVSQADCDELLKSLPFPEAGLPTAAELAARLARRAEPLPVTTDVTLIVGGGRQTPRRARFTADRLEDALEWVREEFARRQS